MKKNRLVNPDKTGNVSIKLLTIPPEGMTVHLKEYGFIKVFRIASNDGDAQYWATDVLDMQEKKERVREKKPGKLKSIIEELNSFVELNAVRQEETVCREHIL